MWWSVQGSGRKCGGDSMIVWRKEKRLYGGRKTKGHKGMGEGRYGELWFASDRSYSIIEYLIKHEQYGHYRTAPTMYERLVSPFINLCAFIM